MTTIKIDGNIPEDEIDRILSVNLKGAINMAMVFASKLIETKANGVIINISSSSIYGGSDAVYSATKSGLIGLTKANAKNFSPYIRVNAVTPGIVKTELSSNISESVIEEYRKSELIKEPVIPEDVANSVFFY